MKNTSELDMYPASNKNKGVFGFIRENYKRLKAFHFFGYWLKESSALGISLSAV
jgi:hypothetical protein